MIWKACSFLAGFRVFDGGGGGGGGGGEHSVFWPRVGFHFRSCAFAPPIYLVQEKSADALRQLADGATHVLQDRPAAGPWRLKLMGDHSLRRLTMLSSGSMSSEAIQESLS